MPMLVLLQALARAGVVEAIVAGWKAVTLEAVRLATLARATSLALCHHV